MRSDVTHQVYVLVYGGFLCRFIDALIHAAVNEVLLLFFFWLIAGTSTLHTLIYLPSVPKGHVERAHSCVVTCMHRDSKGALLKLYF